MQPRPQIILAARTASVDETVQTVARLQLNPHVSVPFCIAAVGGYGRAELFPHSDIDLLVLVRNEPDVAALKEPLAEFLRDLWDKGLRASQSVRTIAECCRLHDQNIELNVSLLNLRLVCGDADLFAELQSALAAFYRQQEERLIRELSVMVSQRHTKFNDTVYHMEPNIKEAPGGLRDIQFLHWLAALSRDKATARQALTDIQDSKEFLFTVRCFLHTQMKRDNNALTFELQDRLAAAWAETELDPAEWMREYYRHARRIFRSVSLALEFAEAKQGEALLQLQNVRTGAPDMDFSVANERAVLRNPAATMSSASSLLGLFTFLARHDLQLSGEAYRAVVNNSEELTRLMREEKIPWTGWREFFAQQHVATALRQMQETGILAAAIPHWSSVEYLVVRDFYHRYTVDEHSIVAIEVIDRLTEEETTLPARFHNLLSEEEHVAALRLALLLHDVGKGTLPGDHVRGSLDVAEAAFEHLSVPPVQRDYIRFLIAHHLDLSIVMNGRDLDDPGTARFLTSRIGTQEDLRRLTLLTFADISAVNPTAMTPWRMEQLWRVYLSAQEQLTRELIANRIDRNEASVLGPDAPPQLLSFLRGFPTRYLRTHSRAEIEHHFQLEQQRAVNGVAVEIGADSGVYLLTVLAPDNTGTFAALCGTLASFGMNILKAEAASNSNGCILDLIRFSDPMRTLELNPDEVTSLQKTIRSVLEGSVKVTDLLKRRRAVPRPSSGTRIAASARFNNEASDECTLIDFNGEDRPGLLYDLTSALTAAGCNIELVLVDTEAHKAIDVFYVTREGSKLEEAVQKSLAATLVDAAHQR